jgi:hypothetical protein
MTPIKEFIESSSSCVLLRTDFVVDLTAINNFFNTEVLKFNKTYQGNKKHGGWSVQSSTGKVSDGWQTGGTATEEELKKLFPTGIHFETPTALCKGPMEQLINDLIFKKFQASRTRFADLESHSGCNWHIDGIRDKEIYGFWRGHIALKTNPLSLIEFKSRDNTRIASYNIPADGYLYLANINYSHRIENTSRDNRVHILTDSALPIFDFQANVEPILSL